jgi:hypothetical protein
MDAGRCVTKFVLTFHFIQSVFPHVSLSSSNCAGAYTPFFRGHAHHDSKRREPWMFGEETMIRLRKAALARYALLPYWYTLFREAGLTGMPVMR